MTEQAWLLPVSVSMAWRCRSAVLDNQSSTDGKKRKFGNLACTAYDLLAMQKEQQSGSARHQPAEEKQGPKHVGLCRKICSLDPHLAKYKQACLWESNTVYGILYTLFFLLVPNRPLHRVFRCIRWTESHTAALTCLSQAVRLISLDNCPRQSKNHICKILQSGQSTE